MLVLFPRAFAVAAAPSGTPSKPLSDKQSPLESGGQYMYYLAVLSEYQYCVPQVLLTRPSVLYCYVVDSAAVFEINHCIYPSMQKREGALEWLLLSARPVKKHVNNSRRGRSHGFRVAYSSYTLPLCCYDSKVERKELAAQCKLLPHPTFTSHNEGGQKGDSRLLDLCSLCLFGGVSELGVAAR